ncbi:Heterokaryon incompatibility protein 6 OR allele, partial [Lachnellula suecica]
VDPSQLLLRPPQFMSSHYAQLGFHTPGDFRLLYLLPSLENGKLACQLSVASLNHAPAYTALSYTWASPPTLPATASASSPDPTFHTMSLNEQPFSVAQNLFDALNVLRSRNISVVWIDAICINQDDLEERGKQVLEMRRIYSIADTVFVWLGSEVPSTSTACEFIDYLFAMSQLPDKAQQVQAAQEHDVRFRSFENWAAFNEFLKRYYWSRAWIVQEIAMARKLLLVCGPHEVSWIKLVAVVQFLSDTWAYWNLTETSSVDTPAFNRIKGLDYFQSAETRKPRHLLQVLVISRRTISTDPRDALYSKLGLAYDGSTLVREPSYTLETAQVFKRLVKDYVSETSSLDIICLAENLRKQSVLSLPSWTPDWTISAGTMPIKASVHQPEAAWLDFHASGLLQANVRFSENMDGLHCDGFQIDSVDGLGGSCPRHLYANNLADGLVQPISQKTAYGTTQEMLRALCQTLSLAIYWDGAERKHKRLPLDAENLLCKHGSEWDLGVDVSKGAFQTWYDTDRKLLFGEYTIQEHVARGYGAGAGRPDSPISWTQFEGMRGAVMYHRRLMITSQGYIGLVPAATKRGDCVCVLLGCSNPVILRKLESGREESYELIGECYIHGMMDGEAVENLIREGLIQQKFTLV